MNFKQQDLRKLDLGKVSLAGADLTQANLAGMNLAERDLSSANLRGAVLIGANLKKANLSNAILEQADLTRTNLLGANLMGAKLSGTKLRRAKLLGARMETNALDGAETFGAALPSTRSASPMFSDFLQHATSMVWDESGDLIFTGSYSGLISIWDAAACMRIRTWQGHPETAGIVRLTYSEKNRLLASCNRDSRVRLWDITNARELKCFVADTPQISCVMFSPVEMVLAIGGVQGALELWDAAGGARVAVLAAHQDSVEALAFSSDGRLLASGGRDGIVQIWEIPSGKSVRRFQRSAKIDSLAFSPDGKVLVSASCGSPLQSWELASGKEITVVALANAHSVAYSRDGTRLATGGEHGISIWNTTDGSEIRKLSEKHPLCVAELAFDPAGQKLAANTSFIYLWDSITGQKAGDLVETQGGLVTKAIAVNSESLAVGAHNSVSFWDVSRGAEVRRMADLGSIEQIGFSTDVSKFVTSNQHQLRLWESNGRELHAWSEANLFSINCISFDTRDRFVAYGGRGGVVLYDVSRPSQSQRLIDRRRQSVLSLAFDPIGHVLAHGGNDGRIVFWDLRTFHRLKSKKAHTDEVAALCFSGDGTLLASGGRDRTVKLFEVASGNISCVFEGHSQPASKLTFSPAGRVLASGASCDSIKLWDLETGSMLRTIPTLSLVTGLAFDPGGTYLIVAQSKDPIQVWEVETGRWVASVLPLPEGWAVFDSDRRYNFSGKVAGYFWHTAGLCRFEPGELDEFLPEIKLDATTLF